MEGAGSALVSTITKHWVVCETTARAILARSDLAPLDGGWDRYLWQDIWRLEGETFVHPTNWRAFKDPLLKTSDLPERDPDGRAVRTIRRYLEKGRIPAIRLAPDIVRVRASVFDVAINYV